MLNKIFFVCLLLLLFVKNITDPILKDGEAAQINQKELWVPFQGKIVYSKSEDFGEGNEKKTKLFLLNGSSGQINQIPNAVFDGEIMQVEWSKSGDSIIVVVFNYPKKWDWDVYVINEDGGNVKKLYHLKNYSRFFVSEDGNIVLQDGYDILELSLENFQNNVLKTFSNEKIEGNDVYLEGISQKKDRLIYELMYEASEHLENIEKKSLLTVNFLDISTGTKTLILDYLNGLFDFFGNLAWSPDSKYIAFIGRTKAKSKGDTIYLFNTKTGEFKKLNEDIVVGGESNVIWTPDGKEIMYSSVRTYDPPFHLWRDRVEIYLINSDGSNKRLVNRWKGTEATNGFRFDWWLPPIDIKP